MNGTEARDVAADRLRESEARFRAFALASSDVVYRMSSDWSVMQQLDGMGFLADTTDPSRGWLLDYIPVDERARVTAEIDGAIQAKSVFELEHGVILADGTTGWTLSRAVPILNETGAIREWIGSAKDVTVRRRIEEDLRRSEDLRRLAIASGRVGIWRWNLHDDVIWGDAAFLSLWGYPASDKPRRLSDFADRMSPQGRVEMGEMITRAVAAGDEFDGLLAVVSGPTDGQWVRWRGRAEEKRPWIVNGVSFDVTDQRLKDERLRESEARHRLLIDSWSQAVWETDARGLVVTDSPSWRAYTGQTCEEWLGDGWLDAIHPDDRAYAERQWQEATAVHGLMNAEFRLRAPDGGWRWTNVRAAPVLDEKGRIEKWAGMNIDIDARRSTEAALRASEELRRIALDGGSMGAWRWDLQRRLIWGDARFLALWGLPPSESPHPLPLFLERMSPEGAAEMEAIVTRAIEAGEEFDRELQIVSGPTAGSWIRWRGRADGPRNAMLHGVSFDITEQRQDATALRESQERLALAIRTLPVGIAILDVAGDVVMANDEMRRFMPTGKIPSRDPIHVSRWRGWDTDGQVVQPDDFPGARALRGETISPGMHMLYRDDSGAEIWTEVLSAPLRDGGGRVTGAISVVVDVDRVKRSEERAQASEERLRRFGEASQDILWIRDADTLQWTYLTPAFETVYGLAVHEALTGDNYRGWQDLVVPEDRPHAVASIARVRAGEHVTFENRIRRPSDGRVRWLRNTDFPMRDETGRVVRIGGVGQDITALKAVETALTHSEQRLRTLVDGVPQLVWRAVDSGDWTWASPQWAAYTGQPEPESHHLGWLEPLDPDDRDRAMTAWAHASETGGFEVEYRIRRADDGTYRWFQTRAKPVRDRAGKIQEWLGTSTDMDDLRRLQDSQAVMVAELQHRTRNLIAVVRGIAEDTMDHTGPTEAFRSAFADRLSALSRVQGLLSRSEAEPITIGTLVRLELDAIGARTLNGRVTATGPEIHLRLSSVQTLALALHELATNARKYGALSHVDGRLAVRWREVVDDGGPRLVLDWSESGLDRSAAMASNGGYGRELIEQALPHALGARTTYALTEAGVRCTIDLAVRPGKGEP